MRDIFNELYDNQTDGPMEAARRAMRPPLRKRFYRQAGVGDACPEGFPVALDDKPVRTPLRRLLAAPAAGLAEAIAAEWNAQETEIDPGRMPLTRLANAVIDAVADAPGPVAAEVENYLACDLLCYRADAPAGLVARQAAAWDPVLAWAHDAFGARFVQVEGVIHAAQPKAAIVAARKAIPTDAWRLAAVSSITTLTGSALLALALAHGRLNAEDAWAAAHVDEDWQMTQWGRDEIAIQRRAHRQAELEAAVTVLERLR
ncbi:MAG TPA: ATP12 family protein [Pseudolabrys sp.]|nr:ATP12 family protein [Pseudolabrys sp.]